MLADAQTRAYPLRRTPTRDTGERFGVSYLNSSAAEALKRAAATPSVELPSSYVEGTTHSCIQW
jgi:hypothetical protein